MNIQCRIRLPDHDFAVGSRHLLCPSVVVVNKIDGCGHVGYSGETYIGIRSQKHNNSSAFSHHQDLQRVAELFPEALKDDDGETLPILIIGTDGGQDENLRFGKNINIGSNLMKEWNLDHFVETILDLREWMKTPWIEEDNNKIILLKLNYIC